MEMLSHPLWLCGQSYVNHRNCKLPVGASFITPFIRKITLDQQERWKQEQGGGGKSNMITLICAALRGTSGELCKNNLLSLIYG